MGIKGLKQFLRKKFPELFKVFNLGKFSGKRLAIDGNNMAFKYYSIIKKKFIDTLADPVNDTINNKEMMIIWYKYVLNFIVSLLQDKIIPIIIFDGEILPEKIDTISERIKRKNNILEKVKVLKDKIEEQGITSSIEDEKKLKNLMGQQISISKDEMNSLKNILISSGLIVITSSSDAEHLASSLAINGKVDLVLSTDSDLLPFGCPLIITNLLPGEYNPIKHGIDHLGETIELSEVLGKLEMTYEQFRDFCILCGCDYNEKIYNIGPVKSYKLIREYRKFETFPESLDLTSLNYQRCREIFSIIPTDIDINFNMIIDKDKLIENKLGFFIGTLENLYKNIIIPTEIEIEYKSPKIIKLKLKLKFN